MYKDKELEKFLKDKIYSVVRSILSILVDLKYGEYLAIECMPFHHRRGGVNGIPEINAWPTEDFVIVMHHIRVICQNLVFRLTFRQRFALMQYVVY